jgi:hypothetical protein
VKAAYGKPYEQFERRTVASAQARHLRPDIRSFLRPGGFLLLTTRCQGGSLAAEVLNLWGAATCGAGRLSAEDESVGQLREAGYSLVNTKSLLPGNRFVAFQAFRR